MAPVVSVNYLGLGFKVQLFFFFTTISDLYLLDICNKNIKHRKGMRLNSLT